MQPQNTVHYFQYFSIQFTIQSKNTQSSSANISREKTHQISPVPVTLFKIFSAILHIETFYGDPQAHDLLGMKWIDFNRFPNGGNGG